MTHEFAEAPGSEWGFQTLRCATDGELRVDWLEKAPSFLDIVGQVRQAFEHSITNGTALARDRDPDPRALIQWRVDRKLYDVFSMPVQAIALSFGAQLMKELQQIPFLCEASWKICEALDLGRSMRGGSWNVI